MHPLRIREIKNKLYRLASGLFILASGCSLTLTLIRGGRFDDLMIIVGLIGACMAGISLGLVIGAGIIDKVAENDLATPGKKP